MREVLKLKNRDKQTNNSPAKASLWFAISGFLQKGIQFLVVPMYIRLMSTAEYGQYSVFFSWYSIISIFSSLKLSNYVFNNGMIKYPNDKRGYTKALLGISFLFTLIVSIILCVSYPWTKGVLSISFLLLLVMLLELFVMPGYELWCAFQRFDYHYKPVVATTLLMAILTPVVGIYIIQNSNAKGVAAISAKVAVSILIYLIPCLRIIFYRKKFFKKEYWKFALRFSLPLIPHHLSFIIISQADRIMISNMTGESSAGIYSLAYSISMAAIVLNDAILLSFNPWLYKKMAKKEYADIRRISTFLIGGLGLCMTVAIFISPEIIEIIATKEYMEAVYILPPLIFSVFLMFLFNLFVGVEYFYEKTKYVTVATTVAAVFNLISNYFLIPVYGYFAATYTTLASYLLMVICHYFFMRFTLKQKENKQTIYNIKIVIAIVFLMIILMAFSLVFLHEMIIRYGIVLTLSVVVLFKSKNSIKTLVGIKISKTKGRIRK